MDRAIIHEDDTLLLQQIADGQEAAFEKLFEIYVPRLYPIIIQIVNSEAAVMDVVQDVFLKLWLNREQLTQIKIPAHYIFRMAYTQSFKHLRQQIRAGRVHEVFADNHIRGLESVETPATIHDLAETRKIIGEAIDILPEQARRIYRLSRNEGQKPQDIATSLGINVQSVRNSLTRSALAIRQHLAGQGITLPFILLSWWLK